MTWLGTSLRSLLLRRLLWRASAFALLAFLLLAAVEIWLELESSRSNVHRRAVQATASAQASIEHAVWNFDEPDLRLATEGLLREGSIATVQLDTLEPSMRLRLSRPDARADATIRTWRLPLRAPGRGEEMGSIVVGETYQEVDAAALARAAYRLPVELLKVLLIVLGLTLLTHRLVIARLDALARQVLALDVPDGPKQVTDIGARQYGDDEIGMLAKALNDFLRQRDAARLSELARERAEASSVAKSELISRMSHELRTPLNAVVGFAQALIEDREISQDATRMNRLALIAKAGRHVSSLLGDLMDLSSLEGGRERVELQPVDVDVIAREAVALVEHEAQQAGIELAYLAMEAPGWVDADPVRLEQVLLNLLSNAIKYNRAGGRVELAVRACDGGWIELQVADTGMGMTGEQLAALYQPFNRLGRESSGRTGSGIGLVITRRLVDLMSGRLDVVSSEQQGTVFTLRLRCSAAADKPREERPPAHPPSEGATSALYLEDDPVNVEVVRAALSSRPGLHLRVATHVSEALVAIRGDVPDIVLTDMHLPDGNGLDLLRTLRSEAAFAKLPILVISADAEEHSRTSALTAGANGYVTKPIDFKLLLGNIDRLLSEAAGQHR